MKPYKLVDLEQILRERGWWTWLARPISPILERVLSLDRLNQIESETAKLVESSAEGEASFFMNVLRVMGVQYEMDAEDFERIPKEGPLLVVSNHPFGGIDGVILGSLLQGARRDSKILGNHLLGRVRGIQNSIVEVDPFDGAESARSNYKGMRALLRCLGRGECIGFFPAGEVSSFDWKSRTIRDPKWSKHVVALALKTKASILPVYFSGRNSILFQLLGLLHPRLRTLLLAREFCRSVGSEKRFKIGKVVQPDRLERFDNQEAAIDYLRLKTYSLRDVEKSDTRSAKLRFPFRSFKQCDVVAPLASAQIKDQLQEEIDLLPAENCLLQQDRFAVFYAKAEQIPITLLEIGRLREETFRAVQEGTGLPRDLDSFDNYYRHLFMWDKVELQIVGAYRIGLVDEVIESHGREGLYTNTLFRFKGEFFRKLGPAIELGRSFISLRYQRKHASLALIWRGIGEFIVRHPQYRTLFGPVSITNAYNSISKDLMVHFFREHNFDQEMSRLVRARNPPKTKKKLHGVSLKNIGEAIRSSEAISAIVSGFEDDAKGIPILLRHYLKLNGSLLSFNLDPAFSDVIDGLILVDLVKTESKILLRYMGEEGYKVFMEQHQDDSLSSVL